jgi:hypothetical protein
VLSVLTLLPIDVTFAIADIDDSAVPNDSACTSVLCARESHRAAPEAVGTEAGRDAVAVKLGGSDTTFGAATVSFAGMCRG